jgi:hypothetical protein
MSIGGAGTQVPELPVEAFQRATQAVRAGYRSDYPTAGSPLRMSKSGDFRMSVVMETGYVIVDNT